jgi:hypothetical protein
MQDLLVEFKQTVEIASAKLLQLSEEESQFPRAAGKWVPKEIVGHLIDSAANNHARFVQAQISEDLVFSGYEQELWVNLQRYREEPWSQLVELWKHYNLHLLHLMASVPKATLMKLRPRHNLHQIAWKTVAESEPVTLEYFMRDYVAHMKHHLEQILGSV